MPLVGILSPMKIIRGEIVKTFKETEMKEITVENLNPSNLKEWNGEGLPPVGVECELKHKISTISSWRKCKVFAYSSEHRPVAAVWSFENGKWRHYSIDVDNYDFRKLESPEAEKEREDLEAAYDLYRYAKEESAYSCVIVGFKEFVSDFPAKEREEYLAIVRKTNYRKGVKC